MKARERRNPGTQTRAGSEIGRGEIPDSASLHPGFGEATAPRRGLDLLHPVGGALS